MGGRPKGRPLAALCAVAVTGAALYAHGKYRLLAQRLRAAQRLLALSSRRDAALEARLEEARARQHDHRHHLAVLRVLLEQGDTAGLGRYLGLLEGEQRRAGELRYTRNRAVDAVLQYYQDLAGAQDIFFTARADLEARAHRADTDVCAVLGNLLENAVNASAKLPPGERWVHAAILQRPGGLVISVKNSFDGRNGAVAGTGMASVRRVAARYGGAAEFDPDRARGEFRALVQLYDRPGHRL